MRDGGEHCKDATKAGIGWEAGAGAGAEWGAWAGAQWEAGAGEGWGAEAGAGAVGFTNNYQKEPKKLKYMLINYLQYIIKKTKFFI